MSRVGFYPAGRAFVPQLPGHRPEGGGVAAGELLATLMAATAERFGATMSWQEAMAWGGLLALFGGWLAKRAG